MFSSISSLQHFILDCHYAHCVGEFNVSNSSLPLDMETCSTYTPRAPRDRQERPWTWPRLTRHHYPLPPIRPLLHRPWCHAPTRRPKSQRTRSTSTWPSRRERSTGIKIHSCKSFIYFLYVVFKQRSTGIKIHSCKSFIYFLYVVFKQRSRGTVIHSCKVYIQYQSQVWTRLLCSTL